MTDLQNQDLAISSHDTKRMENEDGKGGMEKLLLKTLSEWKRKRMPRGLRNAYKQALQAGKDTTPNIFLRQHDKHNGFRAWVAYHLATTKTKQNYKGCSADLLTIKKFEELDANDRQDVAKTVGYFKPHTILDDILLQIANNIGVNGAGTYFEKNSHDGSHFNGITGDSREREHIHDEPDYRMFKNIPLGEIARRFPGIASLIHHDLDNNFSPGVCVTMNFPREGMKDCAMSFEIHSNIVKELAMNLFGTKVESVGDRRYIIQDNGAKLMPSPDIILKGAEENYVRNWLGDDAFKAMTSSNMRTKERDAAQSVTDCISMILTGDIKENSILTLTVQLEWAVNLNKEFCEMHT